MSLCKVRRTSDTLINQWVYCQLKRRIEEQLSTCQGAQNFDTGRLYFVSVRMSPCLQQRTFSARKIQLPFVHITDVIQAGPEHFCTALPEPGLPGLISYDSPMIFCTDSVFHGKQQRVLPLNSKK